MTDRYGQDARVLAEIGRRLAQTSLPKIEVRLPGHLARDAVAAWERDERAEEPHEPDHQRILRHEAATLALIGLAITQGAQWDGDETVVELDAALIGMAIAAADDHLEPWHNQTPPDGGTKP